MKKTAKTKSTGCHRCGTATERRPHAGHDIRECAECSTHLAWLAATVAKWRKAAN